MVLATRIACHVDHDANHDQPKTQAKPRGRAPGKAAAGNLRAAGSPAREADGGGRRRRSQDAAVQYKISAPAIASPYLTTTEAAAYLKLSRQFLEGARWHADGSGPDYVQLGRSVRYIKATLDAWMTSNIHSADKPVVPQARAARST